VNYQVVWCPSGSSATSNSQSSSPPPPSPSPPPLSSNGLQWNTGNGWSWANGCDFTGNDMGSAQVSASQCGPTCQATGGCTHFAWTPPSNCWMKQSPASESNAVASSTAGIICGVQLSFPSGTSNGISWNCNGGWCWALGCDWVGNDIGSAQTSGSDCGPTCASTSGCTHFAWTQPSNCWLKTNSVSQVNAISSSTAGIVCGLNLAA